MKKFLIAVLLSSGVVVAQQPPVKQLGQMVSTILDPVVKFPDQVNVDVCFEYGSKFLCEHWCNTWHNKSIFSTYGVSPEKGFAMINASKACIASGTGPAPILNNGQEIINLPAERKYRFSKKCTMTLDPKKDRKVIQYYEKEKLECVFVGLANTEQEATAELATLCSMRGWQDSN